MLATRDVRSLKPEQLDALREVANIGAGHAATALSTMTGQAIMINVPTISKRLRQRAKRPNARCSPRSGRAWSTESATPWQRWRGAT